MDWSKASDEQWNAALLGLNAFVENKVLNVGTPKTEFLIDGYYEEFSQKPLQWGQPTPPAVKKLLERYPLYKATQSINQQKLINRINQDFKESGLSYKKYVNG